MNGKKDHDFIIFCRFTTSSYAKILGASGMNAKDKPARKKGKNVANIQLI